MEKDNGLLESVGLFRHTGKPASVSKPTSDTETETTSSYYPFPHAPKSTFATPSSSSHLQPLPIHKCHLKSITLPPACPSVLRGTIIVCNIIFEKSVGVRFTLDGWITVSEVLATYSGLVGALKTLVGTNQGKTVGDLIGSLSDVPGSPRSRYADTILILPQC